MFLSVAKRAASSSRGWKWKMRLGSFFVRSAIELLQPFFGDYFDRPIKAFAISTNETKQKKLREFEWGKRKSCHNPESKVSSWRSIVDSRTAFSVRKCIKMADKFVKSGLSQKNKWRPAEHASQIYCCTSRYTSTDSQVDRALESVELEVDWAKRAASLTARKLEVHHVQRTFYSALTTVEICATVLASSPLCLPQARA